MHEHDVEGSASKASAPASGELLRRIVAQGAKGARYAQRGEIARGGMGAILKVWDEDLGRELAMKVVLRSDGESVLARTPGSDGPRLARFLEEAQVTGQLDHPCVVPVHELGLDEQGRVYFTMRLVRGRDLDHIFGLVLQGREGWTETRALGVLLRVCEALAYAHSKGVIHRDLKPANVMVGGFGEVYVMDWGLARVQGRADTHDLRLRGDSPPSGVRTARGAQSVDPGASAVVTMEGDVLGTPAYMPPEQARGRMEEISARSDVYAIGAMLYQLLARRMPYASAGRVSSGFDVLRAVLAGPPTPLRELRSDVPAELEAICEMAMARATHERYPDTLELAEDLRAFLEGRVVKAYQTGALVELRKWVLRNRALAAAGALAVLFLAAGLAASLWQKSIADRNALFAGEQAAQAVQKGALAQLNAELALRREGEASAAARRAGTVSGFLTDMLSSVNPSNSMRPNMTVGDFVDEAARKLDAGEFADDAPTEYALRTTLGDAYQGIYRYAESERQYRLAVDLLPRLPDADPVTRIALDIALADTLLERGDFNESEALFRSALHLYDDSGTLDPGLRARALAVGSVARYNLGSTDDAIAMVREALTLQGCADDVDSETCARTRARLAFFLVRESEYEESLALVDRSIDVLQRGSPRARVEASDALRVRADIRATQGYLPEAIADFEEALRLRSELYGDEGTHAADILGDLAVCKLNIGRMDDATRYARRTLELRQALVGEHRDTATALSTLGTILCESGELAEARERLEAGLEMRRKVLPEGNAGIGDSLRRLGKLAQREGRLAEAERLLRESSASWERSLGPEHRQLAENEVDLGRVLRLDGRPAEARPLFEHALAVRTAEFGALSPPANAVRDDLVGVLLDLGAYAETERLVRATLALIEQQVQPNRPMGAYLGAQMGAALLRQDRPEEAEPLLLIGWQAIGEDPQMWAVNKLFILDYLIELAGLQGDDAAVQSYRDKAAALRR